MCSRDMLGDSYIILVPNGTGIWKPQPGSKKSQELFVKDGNGDFFKHFARFGIIQMKRNHLLIDVSGFRNGSNFMIY